MKKINRVKIYCNNNNQSNEVLLELKEKLINNKFIIVEDNPDIVIAIGGDGSFLRMVKRENYDSDYLYVGINAGTLGFLQEIKISDIDYFIECLKTNKYKIAEVGVQETNVETESKFMQFYSLNEIVVREKDLNPVILNVSINGDYLEKFVGDGLMVATSVGSTAYNLSFGGSIVYSAIHTLQLTPIAPLNNKAYRNLLNPVVVPEKVSIKFVPDDSRTDLIISVDGENKILDNVKLVETKVEDKRLKFLRLENYSFWEKINDKFVSTNKE